MTIPPNTPDWRIRLTHELRNGLKARNKGNEGMARVCARRAAGIIVTEFLARQGYLLESPSAIEQIRFLIDLPETSEEVRRSAELMITRLDTDHKLPVDTDLIAEAQWLAQVLLSERFPE
jgi:hypothetical protein